MGATGVEVYIVGIPLVIYVFITSVSQLKIATFNINNFENAALSNYTSTLRGALSLTSFTDSSGQYQLDYF